MVGVFAIHWHAGPDIAFYLAKISLAFFVAERDGATFSTRSGSPADTVNVRIRFVGKVIVNDQPDAFDVDAAGGDVGGNEDPGLTAAKAFKSAHPSGL